MTKALYQLNLRLNVTSETTASRSFYSDLSYSKAIAELRGAKYCISTYSTDLFHMISYYFYISIRYYCIVILCILKGNSVRDDDNNDVSHSLTHRLSICVDTELCVESMGHLGLIRFFVWERSGRHPEVHVSRPSIVQIGHDFVEIRPRTTRLDCVVLYEYQINVYYP
jgi:hypothetical protein